MVAAAREAGAAATGAAADEIAAVGDNAQNGVVADGDSVKGIAKGMKGIVEAAKELGVELKVAAAGAANEDAGHLFGNDGANANAARVEKATDAVSKVSGKQIIKAIVDSKDGNGQAPADAASPIAAAIGTADAGAAFAAGGMTADDKIAAAIVLRGMAKDGKFAHAADAGKAMKIRDGGAEIAAVDAGGNAQAGVAADGDSVKGIAKGMKGIVETAEELGVELKVAAAAGAGNADAGHLFAGAGNGANAAQVAKATDAVSKVSGKQIIKAIVDSKEGAGKKPDAATSPIEAAIGAAAAGAPFGQDKLRGMAKDGKFAHENNAAVGKAMKIAVESAVNKISGLIKKMMDAAKAAGAAATGGAADEIAAVGDAAAQNGAVAEENSVKGIAKGMKGIVDAAKELGVELKVVAAGAGAGAGNGDAGHLFGNDGANATAAHIEKATDAVSKVSGKQIIKAIVDSTDGAGQAPDAATSPIAAAIGANEAGAPFAAGGMTADDKIAAAIVLRGMAKDGKFAHAAAAGKAMKIRDGSCC
ncbi:variable large family protein [Borreliella lusitaniae]|uniref:Variable large family protein n=1 Tax=Borreliella lusitaniae TaxID=100177 RepID=A0ACD5GN08_9SPIR